MLNRRRQRGFLLNPFAFGGGGGGGGGDPYFSDTVLLCHADGTNGSTSFTNVVEPLGRGTTLTATGTAAVTTSGPLFGTGSLDCGTGGIITGSSTDYAPDSGNKKYTAECAIYTGSPSHTGAIFDFRVGSTAGNGFVIFISGGKFQVYAAAGYFNYIINDAGTVATNTWQRLAVTRDPTLGGSSYVSLAVDGTVVGSAADTGLTYGSSAQVLRIGVAVDGTASFVGKIDEIRFTKGVARYPAGYTVDASAFPDS